MCKKKIETINFYVHETAMNTIHYCVVQYIENQDKNIYKLKNNTDFCLIPYFKSFLSNV